VIKRLNLSTHPFRNRNLPYVLALLMLGISVAGALICFGILRRNSQADQQYTAKITDLQEQVDQLTGRGKAVQRQLSPDQQGLMIAAHKLVSYKKFIWSRLFSDLESVMPGGVSASKISVKNVYSEGDQVRAELDFSVLSHDYSAVDTMISQMNNSGLFQASLRGQDLQKTDRMTFTEYSLRVVYTPTYRIAEPTTDVAQNNAGGAGQ
jgi:Tfp pilus assembly protein PilN